MTKAKAAVRHCPYHHGDLHRAILSAALKVLRKSTEVSLRELARRAGVNHNAPYKHFAEKGELLAAISAAGFELMAKRMTDALRHFPALGLHRKMFMPGPGFTHPEFRDKRVHFRIQLDHDFVGVMVVGGHIVTRCVPRGTPEQIDSGCTQRVRCGGLARTPFELKRDMVDP